MWVKGDNAADKVTSFVKIGRLNARATGNSRVTFTLPSELKKAKTLTICLKDILSDYNQCVTSRPRSSHGQVRVSRPPEQWFAVIGVAGILQNADRCCRMLDRLGIRL